MKRLAGVAVLALLAAGAAAAADQPNRVQGNWEGSLTGGAEGTISMKVIALGDNAYRAIVEATEDGQKHSFELQGIGDERVGMFFGNYTYEGMPLLITARALDGKMEGDISGADEAIGFNVSRVEKGSPTLGAAPPAGATLIFDGNNLDKWKTVPEKWDIAGGAMSVASPQLVTLDEYGSGTYHIEFKTPLMASQRGQGRGNSGVYLLGRYEVQVLDSYGEPPRDNEAGGIYQKAVPLVNASLPPEEWQTYDITFTAAQFDAAGNKTADARITAKHNGILIHDNVALSGPTPGGVSDKDAAAGPLMLQHHGNRVAYRNIWFQPAAQ